MIGGMSTQGTQMNEEKRREALQRINKKKVVSLILRKHLINLTEAMTEKEIFESL
jgi:hypothetical protein